MNPSSLSLIGTDGTAVTLGRANRGFAERLGHVGNTDWARPTPCTEWDVRALVNHVVGANVRYRMLLTGSALAEVEATRDVDHLGDDAPAAFETTSAAMVASFRDAAVLDRRYLHATGNRTGHELLVMRIFDVGVHTWDLARAIGDDESIDSEVVAVALRSTTAIGDEADDTTPQDRLLQRTGRHPTKEMGP